MLIVNLFRVLFTIFQMCMILTCFLVVNFRPCVQGGCNWNMSNIFWEMFYNIICHIFEGGFISFWIITLRYFKCYSDTFYPYPSIFLHKCILRPVRFHHFCSFFMGGVYVYLTMTRAASYCVFNYVNQEMVPLSKVQAEMLLLHEFVEFT